MRYNLNYANLFPNFTVRHCTLAYLNIFFILFTILRTKLLHRVAHSECILGLGQTSLFSCAEPNVNEEKSLF